MSTLKMRACAEAAHAIGAQDRDDLLSRADAYEAKRIEPNKAALMAAKDMLAELTAERVEFLAEFKKQHPGAFEDVKVAEAQGLKPVVTEATHKDPGEPAEPVMPAVVSAAIKTAEPVGEFDPEAAPAAEKSAEPTADGNSQPGAIGDLGEKIGGARKDTATSTGAKKGNTGEQDTRPAWQRRFQISQIVKAGGQIGDIRDDGRWIIRDTRSLDWMKQPRQVGRNTFATRQEAEAAVPLAAVSLKHRVISVSLRAPKTEAEVDAMVKRDAAAQEEDSNRPGKIEAMLMQTAKRKLEAGQITQAQFDLVTEKYAEAAAKYTPSIKTAEPAAPTQAYEIWRDISDRKRVKAVDQQFATREDAMSYMAQNAEKIIETSTTFGEADLPVPENKQRVGAEYRQGDVKGEDFRSAFGFRGIEFGNWNNQEERQQLMNEAYDGLMDLAEVMGIPPEAISLNGELALAFGARGHGLSGARAHYEPERAVMNLTKMKGAGALAHEWFHAADHYFGRQDGKASATWKTMKDGTRALEVSGDFADNAVTSGFSRTNSGVREEIRQAYQHVMETIKHKAEQYVEDTSKAERFVAQVRHDVEAKLADLRKDLAEQKDVRYWKRNNKPATPEQLAEFDAVAQQISEGTALETELRRSLTKTLTGMRWSNNHLEKLSEIYKAVRGRSGFDATNQSGVLDRLRQQMGLYSSRLKMLADAQAGDEKTKKVPTDFAMDAKSLDQGRGTDYWITPHEMAARAFQGYVEDKIAENNGRSPFLNYAPENAGIITPWGVKRPYPAGAERKAINAAFDKLVDAIQTKQTDQGTAMFSRIGSNANGPEHNALKALSENDAIFALPKSDAKDIEQITKDIDPSLSVTANLAEGLDQYVITIPDSERKAFIYVREPSPYGPQSYGSREDRTGERMRAEIVRPGESEYDMRQIGDVWIDVSKLKSGDKGAVIYAIAGDFAHNTGRVFIGDPTDISADAMRRRPEAMASSALRWGTTEHLAPHPKQLDGDASVGVPPLKWDYGDDLGNLRRLIDLNLKVQENVGHDDGLVNFDPSTARFRGPGGEELSRSEIGAMATGAHRRTLTGGKTLARTAVLRALVREEGGRGEGARGRDGLLARLAKLANDSPQAVRGLFSRGAEHDASTAQRFVPLADQSTARALNTALVQYGLGNDWSNAYEAVELPDALSGIREALQTAFGRDVRSVAPTAAKFDIFNGIFIPSQPKAVYVNIRSKVNFISIAGHELWHAIKKQRPDLIAWYQQHSRQYYKDLPAYQAKLNALLQDGEKPYAISKAEEELEADFLGDSLTDVEFLQQLEQASPTKFKALLERVRLWLAGVINRLKGLESSQEVSDVKALRGYLKDVLVAFAEGKEIPAAPDAIAFNRGTNDAVTNPNDVVGNQGGRSADGSTPGASLKPGKEFVSELERLADEHGTIYIRWSPTIERDLTPNSVSRDFVSGQVHSGLSAVEITDSMRSVDIAKRLSEYGFLRMQDPKSVPHVYLAENVGTDSDGYASIRPTKHLLTADKTVVASIDSKLADVMDAEDEVAKLRARIDRFGDAQSAGRSITEQALIDAEFKLAKLTNESTAPASGGAFSRKADQTDTQAFKAWFGNSAVVDADGKPLVVYHGTRADFSMFDTNAEPVNYESDRGEQFFTNDTTAASAYAEDDGSGRAAAGANVMPVYLSMQNPRVEQVQGTPAAWWDSQPALMWELNVTGLGHDGMIIIGDGETMYVTSNPDQIKSIFDRPTKNESTAPESGGAVDGAKFSRTLAERVRNFGGGEKIVGQTTRVHTAEQLAAFKDVGFQTQSPTLEERAKEAWKDIGKKMAQGLVDQFAPVREISKDAYALLRLSKGASGAFEVMLQGGQLKLTDGVYDFADDKRGGVIDKLLKPLQGEHHDFFRWIAANRAERLMGAGKENLFTPESIAAIKTLSDGVTPFDYEIQHGVNAGKTTRDRTIVYADSLKTFNEFNKNVLDMAEQSGLIDGEARSLWENEFYVPFYRVEEDGGIAGADIKNGAVRQQAFKSLTGRTNKLNADLLDNTLMNWAHLLDAAAKNRAAKASIEAAEGMGAAEAVDGPSGKGTVWFRENGERRYSFVNDPYLLTAITALEYAGMRNPAMNAMGKFKRALTIGVTASPFFKVRNLIRDSMQAVASGPINYNPLTNITNGWKLTHPKSDEFMRLMAGGGTIHFGTMMEGNEAKRVQALVESGVDASTILGDEHKVKAFYRKFIEPAVTAYNDLGNRGEAINRASLYDQLIKQGMSHAEASLQARDLMDFSMQGSFTSIRFLSQVVPFFNARLQGLYKLGKAAKEDPQRFARVVGVTALASIGLLMAFGDDDDWKKRPEWDRNNYWWFKFGGTAFRIPKPFEIGAMATLAERGFELAFDKEMTGARFRENVMALLGSNLSMNPIPQLAKPMLDVYANKNSFTGNPIETMAMQKLKSAYRFNGRTSMLARATSTAANAVTGLVGIESPSPLQIDSMVQGYFGWLGSFLSGTVIDSLAKPATGQPTQAEPDYWKAATGGMVSDLQDSPSRYVSQMYDQAKGIEEAYNTWKALLKQGKMDEAAEFRQDHLGEISKKKTSDHIKQAESRINQQIRLVEQSDISAAEKRARIRKWNEMKDRIARPMSMDS